MTPLTFRQRIGDSLVTVRAELLDLRLDVPEGLVVSVVDVTSGAPERIPGPYPAGKLSAAEHMAFEAAEEICRVAAALRRRPGRGYVKPEWAKGWEWRQSPGTDEEALAEAAMWWSADQQHRYEQDHPTGRSDAATYREEAPAPWR